MPYGWAGVELRVGCYDQAGRTGSVVVKLVDQRLGMALAIHEKVAVLTSSAAHGEGSLPAECDLAA